MLLIRQLAVLKLERLVVGKEREPDRVRPKRLFRCRSATLRFFVWHDSFACGSQDPLGCAVPEGTLILFHTYPGLTPWLTPTPPFRAPVVWVPAVDATQTMGVTRCHTSLSRSPTWPPICEPTPHRN